MCTKEIEVLNGKFFIKTVTEISRDVENFEEIKDSLLEIYYQPDNPMFDDEILKAIDPHKQMLINEITIITDSFPEVYRHYNFDMIFYYYSYDVIALLPKPINRGVSLSVGVSAK